jgi:hypothetical protein
MKTKEKTQFLKDPHFQQHCSILQEEKRAEIGRVVPFCAPYP